MIQDFHPRTYAVGQNWARISYSIWLFFYCVNKLKVAALVFIDFLVVPPLNSTAMAAKKTNPVGNSSPVHNTCLRLLHHLEMFNLEMLIPGKANLLISFVKCQSGDWRSQGNTKQPSLVRVLKPSNCVSFKSHAVT